MKITIDQDEYWPFHFLRDDSNFGTECDVPEETVNRWKKVLKDFDEVQAEMRRWHDK